MNIEKLKTTFYTQTKPNFYTIYNVDMKNEDIESIVNKNKAIRPITEELYFISSYFFKKVKNPTYHTQFINDLNITLLDCSILFTLNDVEEELSSILILLTDCKNDILQDEDIYYTLEDIKKTFEKSYTAVNILLDKLFTDTNPITKLKITKALDRYNEIDNILKEVKYEIENIISSK